MRVPLCRPTHSDRHAQLGSAHGYHFWKQLLFEILTDVVSCQGIYFGTIFLQLAYLVDKCRARISARDARIL